MVMDIPLKRSFLTVGSSVRYDPGKTGVSVCDRVENLTRRNSRIPKRPVHASALRVAISYERGELASRKVASLSTCRRIVFEPVEGRHVGLGHAC